MSKAIKIRQTQALFPFGTGAIINSDRQSFIACDISRWRTGRTNNAVKEERLAKRLHVIDFRSPPAFDNNNPRLGTPVYRFPRWLFCPVTECRKLFELRLQDETGGHPKCPECQHLVYPMRFVVACEHGHIQDVPWGWWAHRNRDVRCEIGNRRLRFRIKGGAIDGSLGSLVVECLSCNSSNDLSQIIRTSFTCKGKHPWLANVPASECGAGTKVLQRGASNLRYDFTTETISIPPYTDFEYWSDDGRRITTHRDFSLLLRADRTNPIFDLLAEKIADELEVDESLVRQAVLHQTGTNIQNAEHSMEYEEYRALTANDREHHPLDKFQKKKANIETLTGSADRETACESIHTLASAIESVHILNRLRIVRVLTGYSRINRSIENMVPVNIGDPDLTWLPAVEYYGEGFFIEINIDKIKEFAAIDSVRERGEKLINRFIDLPQGIGSTYPGGDSFRPTPEFVILHTLSHIIMLKMQFLAGYSSSSIRERIYCDFPGTKEEKMSGILLFTSAGDAEGGMGGLARNGKPENLFPAIIDALENSVNCSYDPVCCESPGQGIDGLNLAACYACALVPETSCAYRNQFLDRTLLIDRENGFFNEIIEGAS